MDIKKGWDYSMKRSRINAVIKDMEALIAEHRFEIPPFAKMTADEWQDMGHEYDEIRDNCLGWDITDYGLGNFDKVGFSLLTIRNGNQKMPDKYPKPYAEKLLMLYEGQTAPMHYHWNKMEDIINRGGNDIYITVYNGAEDKSMLDTDVVVHTDGKTEVVPAGTKICLKPGQCIMISSFRRPAVPYYWEKYPCVMMMKMITASMNRSDVFRK